MIFMELNENVGSDLQIKKFMMNPKHTEGIEEP